MYLFFVLWGGGGGEEGVFAIFMLLFAVVDFLSVSMYLFYLFLVTCSTVYALYTYVKMCL